MHNFKKIDEFHHITGTMSNHVSNDNRKIKIKPSNLTDLYFAGDDAVPNVYVHPEICIQRDDGVVHGRGMIVTKDIKAGECLFVTPPTVHVNRGKARQAFKEAVECGQRRDLEEIVMDLLVKNMMEAVKNNEHATINSFLALMGVPGSKEEAKDVSIDTLNGHENNKSWTDEEVKGVNEKHLRSIILKNAFGPDFITYDKIQHQWKDENSTYLPPHILGIYPLAAMLNHSCSANAIRSYAGDTMIVHASKPISRGTEVVWPYIPPTQVFAERRRALKKRHGFVCRCERCMVESTKLKKDILPTTLKMALEEGSKWNKSLLDVGGSNDLLKRQLCSAYLTLEDNVFNSTIFPNEVKRYLRVGYTNLHFNYFNAILCTITNHSSAPQIKQVQEMVLTAATQLHFAFCSSNHASTEHISILHLCYELINAIHKNDSRAENRVKFWMHAMKGAHLIRYGEMGSDLETVRKCLVHTRTLLRQKDGYLKINYNFL